MEPASWIGVFIAVFIGGGMVLYFAWREFSTRKRDAGRPEDDADDGKSDRTPGPDA